MTYPKNGFVTVRGECVATKGDTLWLKTGDREKPLTVGANIAQQVRTGHDIVALLDGKGDVVRVRNEATGIMYSFRLAKLSKSELTSAAIKPALMCAVPLLGMLVGAVLALNLLGQALGGSRSCEAKPSG